MAERYGWLVKHVPYPVRPVGGGKMVPEPRAAGLPDLILVHRDPPRLVFMEVKGDGGRLSDQQQEFLQAARTVADSVRITFHDLVCAGAQAARPQDPIGVMAVWPKDEAAVEQMLRTRVVSVT